MLPLHHDRHETGSCPLRRRRDSNPQPRMKRRLVSTELHYPSATPPEVLCEWKIGESTPWPPACKAGALPTEPIPHDTVVVVRGGIEPPASAVSERRSRPTELPDNCTPCGTRTRSSALKGQETNPYPNGARCARAHCAAWSGLEPELPGTKVRWAAVYPTRQWVSLVGTCGGIRTPCARGQLLNRQPRLTVFASHARHHRLPEQGSNLQSRSNNPLVCRLTDRGK